MIDRFAYTALTGAKHAAGQLTTTTHNLANAQTLGFREMLSAYRATPIQGASADSRAFVVDSTAGFNGTPGTLQQTGNPLDIALVQDGYFAVQVEGGGEAYTRQGRFNVDVEGYLISLNGQRAISSNEGEIYVGNGNKSVYFGSDGGVFVQSTDGEHKQVSQLKVVNPASRELVHRPDGLFEVAGQWHEHIEGVPMKAGAVESSNVNVAKAMVEMIQQNRMFELNMRMVQVAEQNARSAQSLFSLSRV